MIEKIENLLIIISRYFLILIGSLALVGALIALIYSLSLIMDSPNTSKGNLPKITYNEIYKSKLFPKPKKPVTQINAPRNLSSTTPSNNQQPVDKRFVDLRAAIAKQFNDSQDNINKLYSNITPRTLEDFFANNYGYLGDDYDTLISGLTDFFDDIGNINDFKRVGNFDSRLDLVVDALTMYIEDFQDNIQERQDKIQSNLSESAFKNSRGYASLTNVLYGLALYAAAVLYLMIFKVEINLRRIPPAIKRDED
ncbi:MAG: hypothetical protein ACJ0FR_05855 [Gammaproteobacteria bacterium]